MAIIRVMNGLKLTEIVRLLSREFGPPRLPSADGTWELILYENCAYLVEDAKREAVWAVLKTQVKLDPPQLLATDLDTLVVAIRDGGMQPMRRAEKLQECARLAIEECEGDVDAVAERPPREARKLFKLFPGIGEPGADRLLMFAKREKVLALESNGLRVLLRLGYGEEYDNYSKSYRSVQQSLAPELPDAADWLIRAHLLLRRHGQELCRRTKPLCNRCPLAKGCPTAKC